MAPILETSGLYKNFGGLRAVAGVDRSVEPGELHCLIGPNGAGKSTLFKLILGSYPPSGGSILFRGADITREKPFARIRRGISIKLQVPGIFHELPTAQNLEIALQGHLPQGQLASEIDRLLAFGGLADQAAQPAGTLSHGQQQWLEICMAVGVKPTLLLLDEPTAGMSEEETFKTGEMVKQLNAENMTILAVEHDMAFIRQIATRVTVMHFGEIFAQGSIEEITANRAVQEIYLGKSHVG